MNSSMPMASVFGAESLSFLPTTAIFMTLANGECCFIRSRLLPSTQSTSCTLTSESLAKRRCRAWPRPNCSTVFSASATMDLVIRAEGRL